VQAGTLAGRRLTAGGVRAGRRFTVEVSDERFLGPEIFFSPGIYTTAPVTPLPLLLDQVIQSCPIDTRRCALLQYCVAAVLGGCSTGWLQYRAAAPCAAAGPPSCAVCVPG
jgi:hypothetical protein